MSVLALSPRPRFGIEPHEAPTAEIPKQPSRKDGLGTMCTVHWRAYVKGLREARVAAITADAATAASAPEADAASRDLLRLDQGPGRESGTRLRPVG